MFRYLLNGGHGNPVRFAEMGLQGAAAHGDLETVQWLFRDFIDPNAERLRGIGVESFTTVSWFMPHKVGTFRWCSGC